MNVSLETGKLTLTKRDKEHLEMAPKLAAMIALHRPAVQNSVAYIKDGCQAVLWAALKEETAGKK